MFKTTTHDYPCKLKYSVKLTWAVTSCELILKENRTIQNKKIHVSSKLTSFTADHEWAAKCKLKPKWVMKFFFSGLCLDQSKTIHKDLHWLQVMIGYHTAWVGGGQGLVSSKEKPSLCIIQQWPASENAQLNRQTDRELNVTELKYIQKTLLVRWTKMNSKIVTLVYTYPPPVTLHKYSAVSMVMWL